MGLLTDPGAGRGKFSQCLVNYHGRFCLLMFVASVAWFLLLAHEPYNAGTYFSENALLPGLVKGEFSERHVAQALLEELRAEAQRRPDATPHAWLTSKMRQLGLDVFSHDFSLIHPLGLGVNYTGRNVYGIVRAARASSTEALVLAVPYRPPTSAHPDTLPGVALALALAKFFRRQKYWAKDVIILITEHEQLGAQAWLEAYHGGSSCGGGALQAGDLRGRSGAIQAAVVLELHAAEPLARLELKIEGLHGQLPNLDLVNLLHRLSAKEGVPHTFHSLADTHRPGYTAALRTLAAMMRAQAAGVPNGNHGLFHRFGISAVTIEGFEDKDRQYGPGFHQVGRVIEGVFRSLNNLLERFHQSFFFYLLPSSSRYISIGLYMPSVCLLAGALLVKAFAAWLRLHEGGVAAWAGAARALTIAHLAAALLPVAAETAAGFGLRLRLMAADALAAPFAIASVLSLAAPLLLKWCGVRVRDCAPLLHIWVLLELAVALVAVAMHNVSLALLVGVLYTPLVLSLDATGVARWVVGVAAVLVHPATLLTGAVAFGGIALLPWAELHILESAKQALVFAAMDRHIYGSWMLQMSCTLLLPLWMLLWAVLLQPGLKAPPAEPEKTD